MGVIACEEYPHCTPSRALGGLARINDAEDSHRAGVERDHELCDTVAPIVVIGSDQHTDFAGSDAMKQFLPLILGCLVTAALSPAQAETLTQSIQVEGVERSWQLFVPPTYSANTKHALVLDFHGSGGTPQGQSRNSDFIKLAGEKSFLVANPAGKYIRDAKSGASWNVDLDPKGVDDVRFVRELIAHLRANYSIDPQRIYSTGFSGGARMSSRLTCDLSDVIAAVGPVGGIRFPEKCTPAQPVAVIAFHGEQDEVNHFEHRSDSPAYWPVGVNAAISSWAKQNRCNPKARKEPLATGVTKFLYENCTPGADVVLITLKDGKHTWPGSAAARVQPAQSSSSTTEISATQLIWQFFDAHPKQ
jgi:polyhydroxybutyrate depolymerase